MPIPTRIDFGVNPDVHGPERMVVFAFLLYSSQLWSIHEPKRISKAPSRCFCVAKVAAGSIPFTGIVKRMLGAAVDEVAEMWRDQIRVYWYGRRRL